MDIAERLLKRGSSHLPSYRLLIRKCDHAMMLLDQRSGEPVPHVSIEYDKRMDGYYVSPARGITAYLMDDEIRYVDDFPELRDEINKARHNTGKAEM